MTLNTETLQKLFTLTGDDDELRQWVDDALQSFSAYHAAIYRAETWKKLYAGAVDAETYRKTVTEQDHQRTACHNALLAQVSFLNKLAAQKGLAPVYDGVVSEERPYRRQVANAVLAFVESVIANRS